MREWSTLLSVELLKLLRRRLTWVLVLGLAAISVVHANYLQSALRDYRQAEQTGVSRFGQPVSPEIALTQRASLTRRMSFPGVLDELWVTTDLWGVFGVLILGALISGEEFDAGTARTILMRGPNRGGWLLAKLTALMGSAAVAWLVLALVEIPLGLWTQAQATGSLDLSGLDAARWLEHGARLVRSWLSLLPYAAFALAAGILARGSGLALALGVGARFVELVSGLLGTLLIGFQSMQDDRTSIWFDLWAPLHVASFEWNARVWRTWGDPMGVDLLVPFRAQGSARVDVLAPLHDNPWLAGLVLLGWATVWLVFAWRRLRREDIVG